MVDGTDNQIFSAGILNLYDETHSAASPNVSQTIYSAGRPVWNGLPDLVLFNISGAQSGGTFTINAAPDPATNTGTSDTGINALFFDIKTVPEPSTLGLGGLMVFSLAAWGVLRRRKRA
jgi:hypothetical protein